MRRTLLAGTGGVVAAFLGSLCCVGPLAFVALGVGAGLASTFEPLRPIFGVLMVAMLGLGFYTVYGRRPAKEEIPSAGGPSVVSCTMSRKGMRDRVLLWSATGLAVLLWTFPTWSRLFV